MVPVFAYVHPQDERWSQVQAWLRELQPRFPHQLVVIDITQEPGLQERYGGSTPVLEIGPYTLRSPFPRKRLEVTLAAARDGQQFRESLGMPAPRPEPLSRLDRFTFWVARHFLWLFLGFLTLYVALPWLAPVMMRLGWYAPARWIYSAYGFTCHQLAFRSWFLFGEQPAYPRAAAGVPGLKTFGEVTGISEDDLWAARNFIGTPELGYKVAICQRDVALWGAFWLFTVVFTVLYRWKGIRLRPLRWYWWILVGWVPIGLDGFSQLLSQIPGSWLPYRESTPLLRTLTGALFGLTTAWFMFPMMVESMEETRRLLLKKQRWRETAASSSARPGES